MADYVANVPISKPVVLPVAETKSLGGMSWNRAIGLFYRVEDEQEPFRQPVISPRGVGGARFGTPPSPPPVSRR